MPVILGLDYGEARIGVAVSDPLMISANALDVIKRKNQAADMEAIRKIIAEKEVDRVIVGLPINMDGSEGPMAKAAREFAKKILDLGADVALWDERLSSKAAEAALIEADMSRKKRKNKIDQVAAAWFLQSFLDAGGTGGMPVED